jgi:polyisoprenoid-binding protein YceI
MKKIAQSLIIALLAITVLAPKVANAQVWASDQVHSTVMYTVKHVVTPMLGVFKKFNIEITFDPEKPLETKINGTLDASSVMMGIDKLEEHLKGPDFFDVVQFPEWSFQSTGITLNKKVKSKNGYFAAGKLTVHGVTKEVTIPFEFLGKVDGKRGSTAGFSAEFTINRVDYGVGKPDNGGMLSNDVKINVMLEMHPKK